jgi:para-aminobenzoate synthetase component 1
VPEAAASAGRPGDLAPVLDPRAPIAVVTLDGWVEPIAVLQTLRGARRPALLLSALDRHPAARWSILAWDPVAEIVLRRDELIVRDPASGEALRRLVGTDPFEALRALLPAEPDGRAGDLPFAGGAIGYLGYGLRTAIERLPRATPDPLDQPDGWFGVYDGALVFDHHAQRIHAIAVGAPDRRLARARAALAAGRGATSAIGSPAPQTVARAATPRHVHEERIARVLDHIGRGDIYQANLSHRITCTLREPPSALFARLMARNPSPFAACLDTGELHVVGASPERFVSLHDGLALSSPIKGTRPRGRTPREDEALALDLIRSAKDRAENVMIVDLVRNDLGRVAQAGSVRVDVLCGLESFATVHHLVSSVSARLRPGRDQIDLLRALFPGGSMTGAPKIRAMEIITELEEEERGVYSGSIGYLSRDGRLDFNIVIRTIVCAGGRADLRVGGGIVADSDPAAEYAETIDKARALLAALGAEPPPRY